MAAYPGVPKDSPIYRAFDHDSIIQSEHCLPTILKLHLLPSQVPHAHIEKPNMQEKYRGRNGNKKGKGREQEENKEIKQAQHLRTRAVTSPSQAMIIAIRRPNLLSDDLAQLVHYGSRHHRNA